MRSPLVATLLLCLPQALLLVACSGAAQEPTSADRERFLDAGVTVTFNEHVAPLVFAKCSPCHRPKEVAPFALLDYRDVSKRAVQIADVVESRYMPPWKPEPGVGSFVGERWLTAAEIDIFSRWADSGAAEGDSASAPPPPEFTDGWQLGEPDLIVETTETYTLGPEGKDVYRNFVLPSNEPERRYVRAVEFRPHNRRVVHHTNLWTDTSGDSRLRDALDPEPGFEGMWGEEAEGTGQLVGWHPGRLPILNPPDVSWPLEQGADILVLAHLLPTGKPEPVGFTLGFYFADEPPARPSIVLRLASKIIDIPVGVSDYTVEDSFITPVDLLVFSMRPHAHYLGKDLRGLAQLPDGTQLDLIHIPDWDANWQEEYQPREPVLLPAGSQLGLRFSYDNTAGNIRNPNVPPQPVRWGPGTQDEMGVLFTQVLVNNAEDLATLKRAAARHERAITLAGWQTRLLNNPQDPDVLAQVGVQLSGSARIQEALQVFQDALRIDPEHAAAHVGLGVLSIDVLNDLNAGVRHFRAAVASEPENSDAQSNLGKALLRQGEPEEALLAFEAALRADPLSIEARQRAADLHLSRGQHDQAIAQYRALLEARPASARGHIGMAGALRQAGRAAESLAHFRRAIEQQADKATWHYEHGLALADTGEPGAALQAYLRASRLDPDFVPALRKAAWTLGTSADAALRDPARALSLARKALSKAGKESTLLLDILAAAEAASGDFEHAVATATRAVSLAKRGRGGARLAAIQARLAGYRRGAAFQEKDASSTADNSASATGQR